jgi:hypothetical protein
LHGTTAELKSLTHIEIDVANFHQIKAIPAESTQIRTGGSLSSSNAVGVKGQGKRAGIDFKP